MKRFILFILAPAAAAAISYEINFVGLKDQPVLKAMFDVSDLVTLQDRPPASINGLRYRINSDIPALMKVLRAYGYYEAAITSKIENEKDSIQVYLYISAGPQYKIASYEVFHGNCTEIASVPNCCPFTPEVLGLDLGKPALAVNIVNAEQQLLISLAKCGYPLASVEKRKIEVDMADKTVNAAACIQEGPLSKFGPISIFGLKDIEPRYVARRVAWKEGEIYTPDSVEETQKRLLNSDLFSSVLISHEETLDSAGELPMKLRVTEAKHRQVSVGAFYATVDGPGVSFSWTHRNLRGMGEIISLDGEFSKRFFSGAAVYKKPDFLRMDQSYRAVAELSRENVRPYIAFTYRFTNTIERKISERQLISIGLDLEHITVSKSASNGTYLILGLPFFAKYNGCDNLLEPTSGYTLVYQGAPFQSLEHGNQQFLKQRMTITTYIPMFRSKRIILALRAQFGSIAGTNQRNIPLTKLFLGGTEDDLRGYRYKTVSPLNSENKPLGGRSAIFATIETRIRITKTLGFVPFADFGTVTFNQTPQFKAKWFKSVGVGLRYYTFFGALRFDIGFPLNRREGVDKKFGIYASVGQSF
ncbi:MAG: BamA/TamA family outer membrane protein [Chlamydiota bacterium]